MTYLASIPESYPKYDDVKNLQSKIKQNEKAPAQERERQRQIAEAERKAKELAEEARRKAEEPARLAVGRKMVIESGFSFLDGSHRGLTALIKKSMNDPESYGHVETTYGDKGDHLMGAGV